ncbi:carcinine hydrolase/isopenicillin-N N-acyltransferase family protein [candidate division CSSED10-310 bacterium]|uniref:Carcinine hydrolase/isopenicillin-N N-acyltransferase family protein n=1 Tax=candidate division CSSED10-310 bacterium TaxID=2855610 RepID=A0ABV6Z217_UNCC1
MEIVIQRTFIRIFSYFLCILYAFSLSLEACTLWAAAGTELHDGGTLIAKNRDWDAEYKQELRIVHPENGFSYFGIFVDINNQPELKAGVNIHGLVAISASVSSIPQKEREKLPHTPALLQKLLKNWKSVDEALSHQDWFLGPRFVMLADKVKIALIEIAPDGKLSIDQKLNGVLFHANHYVSEEFIWANKVKKDSSLRRQERICSLMSKAGKKFYLGDFITISNDRSAGPDNSIWRTGSSVNSTRTHATWIVFQPFTGDARLYLKLANKGEQEKEYNLFLKEVFSNQQKITQDFK